MMTIELLPETQYHPASEPMGPGLLRGERGTETVAFPLAELRVEARLSGPVANVDVRQRFTNPYSDPIEAVYIFPLPAGAAVYRFRMTVKDRVVDGIVQERAQARATYEEGVRQGHRSALMEMERDNVFTVHLGNLPPGESIAIDLSYAHRVEVQEAENLFRFPLVVAPRYIPGDPLWRAPVGAGTAADTQRVPDASRLTPPRLVDGLNTGANLSIKVALETGGLAPARLACSQHVVEQNLHGTEVVIELAREGELLNRDFVLKYRLADTHARGLLLATAEHFLLQVVPPTTLPRTTLPLDVVFVLDRSGSMGGPKMQSARLAVSRFLDRLNPSDRFTILAFDNVVEDCGNGQLLPAQQVKNAQQWLGRIEARGGTEIREALIAAMDRTTAADRLGCIVIITDGQVGNEPELYRMVQQRSPRARIFTLGIDTAVNDAFLRRLAGLGRGTCELVTPGEALTGAVDRLSRDLGTPVVTDLTLHDEGFGVVTDSLAPALMPDVFATRSAFVLGRHHGSGSVRLEGRPGYTERLAPTLTTNPALAVMWARDQITALEDRLRIETVDVTAVHKEILDLALQHQLLTRFTAFVLVDRAEVVAGAGDPRTVVQPVEMPAEWAMDKAAGAGGAASSGLLFRKASMAPGQAAAARGRSRGSSDVKSLSARKGGSASVPPPPVFDSDSPPPPPPASGYDPFSYSLPPPSPHDAFGAVDAVTRTPAPLSPPAAPSPSFAAHAAPSPAPVSRPAPVVEPHLATLKVAVEHFSKLWQEAQPGANLFTPEVKHGMEQVLKALALIGSTQTVHLMEAGAKLNTALKLDRVEVASMGAWLDEVRRLVGLPPLNWWSDNI